MFLSPRLQFPDGQLDPYAEPELPVTTDTRRPVVPTYVPDADPAGGARYMESSRSMPIIAPGLPTRAHVDPVVDTPLIQSGNLVADQGTPTLPTVSVIGQKVKNIPKLAIVAAVLLAIALLAYFRSGRRARA